MVSALRCPGHPPGPQGSLGHSGKPLGLGHYSRQLFQKIVLGGMRSPCLPISPSHYPNYLRNQTACSSRGHETTQRRAGTHAKGRIAHSVETDGVSLCSSLFHL